MRSKPKKSLGQNFLFDKNVQNKIITSCGFDLSDTVLEIGSGRGELTSLIVQRCGSVYAVEIDRNLFSELEERFSGRENLKLINSDILKLDIGKLGLRDGLRLKVFGNIPYYISSPILEHLINHRDCINSIYLTVQKEFAQRIACGSGSKEYGSLSCFVQYYLKPRILFHIKKNSFFPAPKVDSSFVEFIVRQVPAVKVRDEGVFFNLIRKSFNKRRKTLRNSLKDIVPAEKLELFFSKFKLDRNIRPELLSLQDFANLANL
jgi:16S rRNA (adenine1518-N6/adenine1519-N6)-dimethyltransferase